MDDPIFKQKYQKYKFRVKLWEKDFRKKYNRIPSKYDIRDAPKEIRDSYKMYYKLKTSFLEDTLSDVLSEDGFDVFENLQGDMDDSMQDVSNGPQLPLDISNISNMELNPTPTEFSNINEIDSKSKLTNLVNLNEHHVIKEFEPVQVSEHNLKAWGTAVTKKPPPAKKPTSPVKQFKSNVLAKLFKASTSMRNPRKSLSKPSKDVTQSQSTPVIQSMPNDLMNDLPDLETILAQRAKETAPKEPSLDSMHFIGISAPEKKTSLQLDPGWLKRNVADGDEEFLKATQTFSPVPMGMSNINNIKIKEAINATVNQQATVASEAPTSFGIQHDSDSVVSNSEEENGTQEYRHIAKRRRVLTTIDRNQQLSKIPEKEPEEGLPAIKDVPQAKEDPGNSSGHSGNSSGQESVKPRTRKKAIPKKAKVKEENEEHYSSDEEGKTTRKTRKKAVPKKVSEREENEEINSSDEEGNKPKRTRKKQAPKKAKPEAKKRLKKENPTTAPAANAAAGKRGRKKKVPEEPEMEEAEETAPDIESIKYNLALETRRVTCLPRANLDDLKKANSLAEEYINKADTAAVKSEKAELPPTNEKNAASRSKLEDKIASGKLNENFVRINLQKKVFVRGKKVVNYSRYKKKLWKEKKASALTGPDMDMGGCDGGVLTCFTCGQTGHFARQCKVKGDSLLPLSVEIEEESPFMTLEEAERLASQTAVAVHSRNLSKLPEATNPLLCRGTDDEASEDEPTSQEDPTWSQENEPQETLSQQSSYIGHKIPEDFLKKAGLLDGPTIVSEGGALYDLNPDGSVAPVTDEVYEVLRMFGHTAFRKGQDRAIMRILSGQSTLVTLSTGSGKSLCYQLPAYLYSKKKKSITLVISPLVSLMEDQVHGVPHFLRALCLHTNQTPQQRMKILEQINNGEVDILLVSPEAVVAGERSTGFGSILRKLPPIAFACIDEAHCVSQWSHNFRPSYLMICKVLQKNLGVQTVLGLTATATLPTRQSIIRHLSIPDGEKGIISDVPLPDNLIISVSKDENRDAALIELLLSERFSLCQSIIIYCTRRDECERIAGQLRTYMQDRKAESDSNGKKKRKRVSWQAEPYHAGLAASRRRTIQNAFMKNELRIVVATIAFGMGINKPDIRSVIHYNMPRNFESYVQEIGRAGRDGKTAHCHLFLDSRGNDQNELRRHIYANSIDRHVIRKLLVKIFIPCSCDKNLKKSEFVKEHEDEIKASQDIDWEEDVFSGENIESSVEKKQRKRVCPGHEIGFSIEETVQMLDIPEENISTLLCYLELDGRWGINVLSSAYIMCKVISYNGSKYLKHAAKDCPPLAMAIAQEIKKKTFDEDSNTIQFSVVDIAAAIGWNSGVMKYQLKNLEWVNENGYPKRSPLSVQFFNLGFRIKAPGDFTLDEIDEALDTLYNRAVKQETTQLIQLQYVFKGLSSVSYKSYRSCAGEDYPHERSDQLKAIIRDYFQNDYPTNMVLEPEVISVPDDAIISDIHSIIGMYPDNNFSGRNIARIFHGIPSPNYPAVIWGRCKFWRAHSKSDFNRIVKLANSAIIKMRT